MHTSCIPAPHTIVAATIGDIVLIHEPEHTRWWSQSTGIIAYTGNPRMPLPTHATLMSIPQFPTECDADDLDDLPVGAVIVSSDGDVAVHLPSGQWRTDGSGIYTSDEICEDTHVFALTPIP